MTSFSSRAPRPLRRCAIGGVLVSIFFASQVFAGDSATRGTVRGLAKEGVTAYESGDYELASKKLEAVYATVKIPTFALLSARALEKTGHLVEASERYLEATRLADGEGEPVAQERARDLARAELKELLPRVPQLIIRVAPEGTEGLVVMISNVEYANALLGAKRPTNPGPVTVAATRGEIRKEVTVTLKEGATEEVLLQLGESTETGSQPTPPTDDPPMEPKSGGTGRKLLIYGGFSLAAAGGGVGAVTGIMALSQASQLKSDYGCDEDGLCDEGGQDSKDKVTLLGTVSTIGFGVGIVGLGLGIFGLLLDPPGEAQPEPSGSLSWNIDVGQNNSLNLTGSF